MNKFPFPFSFPFSFSLALSLLSLPLFAVEKTAMLDFEQVSYSTPVSESSTTDSNVGWAFSRSLSTVRRDERGDGNKHCLSVQTGLRESVLLIASYVGAAAKDIPNIRSFSFMARTTEEPEGDLTIEGFDVRYRVDRAVPWQTAGLSCSPSLDALSTEWQTFTVTLPNTYFTAELMILVRSGSNTILLDDLTVTYDPDYVAPAPGPDPESCTNCFQISF